MREFIAYKGKVHKGGNDLGAGAGEGRRRHRRGGGGRRRHLSLSATGRLYPFAPPAAPDGRAPSPSRAHLELQLGVVAGGVAVGGQLPEEGAGEGLLAGGVHEEGQGRGRSASLRVRFDALWLSFYAP